MSLTHMDLPTHLLIALAGNKSCLGPGCWGLSEFLRFTVTQSFLTHVINPSRMLITIPNCRYAKS